MANKPNRYGKLVIYIYYYIFIIIYTVHVKKLVKFITNSHVYICLYLYIRMCIYVHICC